MQTFHRMETIFDFAVCSNFRQGFLREIENALVDANWGQSTDIVYQFCRQSVHAGIIMPSHGRYVGASSKPMTEYRRQPGDKLGFNWMIPNVAGKRAIRYVIYDTNYWKSFIHARLGISLAITDVFPFMAEFPVITSCLPSISPLNIVGVKTFDTTTSLSHNQV